LPKDATYEEFAKHIKELYSVATENLVSKYKDDEGDLVTFSTPQEWKEMIQQFVVQTKESLLRIELSSKEKNETVHYGVTCDGCNTRNFSGSRYKCTTCDDFDFCTKCYQNKKTSHGHEFKLIERTRRCGFGRPWWNRSHCQSRMNVGPILSAIKEEIKKPEFEHLRQNPFVNTVLKFVDSLPKEDPTQTEKPKESEKVEVKTQPTKVELKPKESEKVEVKPQTPTAQTPVKFEVKPVPQTVRIPIEVKPSPVEITQPKPVEKISDMEEQLLASLYQMGFVNKNVNLFLLRKFNHNIDLVINSLLQ